MTEIRGFHHHSQAWWFHAAGYPDPDIVDMVSFGLYDPDSCGTYGELSMTWERLGSGRVAARLSAWDDAWHALARFGDVVEALAARRVAPLSPTDFTVMLTKLGFVDRTERVRQSPRQAQGRQLIAVRAAP